MPPPLFPNRCFCFLLLFTVCLALTGTGQAQKITAPAPASHVLYSDNFRSGTLDGWTVSAGNAATIQTVNGTPALQTIGYCEMAWGNPADKTKTFRDITVSGDIFIEDTDVSSGFIVRANGSGEKVSGYYACVRKLKAGYDVVQLFRLPERALLQEARIQGTFAPDQPIHLRLTCKGAFFWVWANHTATPAITEFDDTSASPGFVRLRAENKSAFSHIVISTGGAAPRPPYVHDWSKVKGAVFITSDAVNSYQMWEEYRPAVVERELTYAQKSRLNLVQVYLNFLMWQKNGPVYLARIDDFLKRAARHGLQVTFIFFDDVGNIEPPHLAPYADPVPGVHNSQMQGCPGRAIVDRQYNEYRESLKQYVQAIVKAHVSDKRIAFWQTYNEPSHATTLPLLADSYQWIKQTGSKIPVSATGGGAFYGSYYSDFPTFHSYLDPNAPPTQEMVLGDGGPEHLCTETLDRPGVDVPKLVRYFAARKTGWVIWELMIGRDNCRFPWGSPQNAPEPAVPFHGLLYPNGSPWSETDIQAIRGKTP